MKMNSSYESREANRVWAAAFLAGLVSAACGGGGDAGPSSSAAGPNSGRSTDTAVNALCGGGEVVASGDDEIGYATYEGDTAFLVVDWTVEQVDLRTGDKKPMFTIDQTLAVSVRKTNEAATPSVGVVR